MEMENKENVFMCSRKTVFYFCSKTLKSVHHDLKSYFGGIRTIRVLCPRGESTDKLNILYLNRSR